MTDSFRLRVLKAITTAIRQVTPANGYQNDLSASVFRGRTLFGENDPLPMVSILEAPLQPDQLPVPTSSGANFGDWELLIQGFVVDDHENPTDPAHELLAEVKKALAVEMGRRDNILGLGPKVDKIMLGTGTCRPADEVSARAYFWMPLVVKLMEDLDDPFA
jgi:hypothetical protein